MKKNLTMIKGEGACMVVGKVVAHLCLTLIIKELKFSVEHDRVITTLNTIKHQISYLV
jgi:ribose 5-phosphate isomerase